MENGRRRKNLQFFLSNEQRCGNREQSLFNRQVKTLWTESNLRHRQTWPLPQTCFTVKFLVRIWSPSASRLRGFIFYTSKCKLIYIISITSNLQNQMKCFEWPHLWSSLALRLIFSPSNLKILASNVSRYEINQNLYSLIIKKASSENVK